MGLDATEYALGLLFIGLPRGTALAPSAFTSATRNTLWKTYSIVQANKSQVGPVTVLRTEPPEDSRLCETDPNFGQHWDPMSHDIILDLLLNTIESLVHNIPRLRGRGTPYALSRHLIELLSISHAITPDPRNSPVFKEFIPRLVIAYNATYKHQCEMLDAEHPGLRSSLVQFIWQFIPIQLTGDEGTVLELSSEPISQCTLHQLIRAMETTHASPISPLRTWFDNWRNLWDNLPLAKRKGLVTGFGRDRT